MSSALPDDIDEAWRRFDALPPVPLDFMWGLWRGSGCPSGHPMDGALEAFHWWGKRFEGPEAVHPLLFEGWRGGLISVHPGWLRPFLPMLRSGTLPRWRGVVALARSLLPLLAARRAQARLRMVEHRGVVSATMIYDGLPIQDIFRRLDADTVLGRMDLKDDGRPFYFVLRRVAGAAALAG